MAMAVATMALQQLGAVSRAAAPPPHVFLAVVDDLGHGDVGYNGGDMPTPVLDALALDGVRLTSFYTQPLCSPSRAALLTGVYPFRRAASRAASRVASWAS